MVSARFSKTRSPVAFDGVTHHCVAPPRQLVRTHRLDFQIELSRDKVRVTLGFLLDRHAEKLFFKGRSRDAFLRRLPRGVAYLERKRPGNRWVPTWNLMVPETFAPSTDQVVRT